MIIAKIFYETEEGERHLLGKKEFLAGGEEAKIHINLIDSFWDVRLTAASCIPVIILEDIED